MSYTQQDAMLRVRSNMQSHVWISKPGVNFPDMEVPDSPRSTLLLNMEALNSPRSTLQLNMELRNSPRSAWQLLSPSEETSCWSSPEQRVEKLVAENPVVVFAMSYCCMCQVVKHLFFSLGVNLTIYELDMEPGGAEIEKTLSRLGVGQDLPAIYVGGKLIGSLDRLMTAHIIGTLVPQLKEAGALWL